MASLGAVAVSFAVFFGVLAARCGSGSNATSATPTASTTAKASPTLPASPGPDGDTTPLVACGDILAPLDKDHRLAPDCAPPDLVTLPAAISYGRDQQLRKDAAVALEEMLAAAAAAGQKIFALSSYRSYEQQVATFQQNVADGGKEYAERTSAHPGHSEHQMGTATDLTSASNSYGLEGFEKTPESAWVAANSWRYGFILSYPAGKEAVTGYAFEPWHVRWIGKENAAKVHDSGLTLHEWLLNR
jgi:LAS superfamily LD-carboxypeptidase LdcB